MNQSLRRTRSRGSFTATTQHPYRQSSNGALSSRVSFGEGGHGGGKIRSRSSLLSLVGRSGRRVGSVPAMSSQGGCSKKKIRSSTSYIAKIQTTTSSSREELLQEGRSKSPLVEEELQEARSSKSPILSSCQSTPLIRRRGVGEVKPYDAPSSRRVSAESGGSSRHNDEWGEAIGDGIPPASSPLMDKELASILKLKTTSPTSILKTKTTPSSKRPTSALTSSLTLPPNNPTPRLSSPESRQRRRGLAKSWQSAMLCIQQHRQPISQPIPIVNQCPREREEAAITADAAVQYNAATWRMYNRIQTVRRQSDRAYAAPHELMMQDRDNHSHVTPEEVGVVEEEEDDDGVFDLEL